MRIGDVIEDMLTGMLTVIRTNDRALAERLRKKDDVVDALYTAVKLYLTQISRGALDEREGRRWADIVSFTINLEQVGDIIERVLTDIEDKKIGKQRNFSEAGMAEICDLHARLVANLRLGMSVFLHGDLKSAQELLAQKVLFRDLERAYADSHLGRLAGNTLESIETSSLHLDLISDLKRINSHICSIAYEEPARSSRKPACRPHRAQGAGPAQGRRRSGRAGSPGAANGELAPSSAASRAPCTRRWNSRLASLLAVLAAGLLHASWNAILKSRRRAAAIRCSTPRPSSGSTDVLGARVAAVRARAARRVVADGRDVGGHPLRLLPRRWRMPVPHGRPVVRVSADARHRTAHRHGPRHAVPARVAVAAGHRRHARHPAHQRRHLLPSRSRIASSSDAHAAVSSSRRSPTPRIAITRWSTRWRSRVGKRLGYVLRLTFVESSSSRVA